MSIGDRNNRALDMSKPHYIDKLAADKLERATQALLLDHIFYGMLTLKLNMKIDRSCPTAYVNGEALGYNPSFIRGLTKKQTLGLLVHEVLHVADGHCWRRGLRDHRKWNVACDYVINLIAVESGHDIPENGLIDARYKNMSPEQVYDLLPDGGMSSPMQGEVRDSPLDNNKEMEQEWKVFVEQAAQVAKAQGQSSAGMGRLIERNKPKADALSVLHRFVERTAANDYTFVNPNPNYLYHNLYLPCLQSDRMPEMVVAIDTSGSVSKKELSVFSEYIGSILDQFDPEKLWVLFADSQVQEVHEYDKLSYAGITSAKGGGGTDFTPVFKWVDDEGITPACLVYFTDMCGRFPNTVPEYPVLWMSTGKDKAPWGEVVNLNVGEL